MTDTSVTIADIGTVIATDGTLVSATLAEPPGSGDATHAEYCFTLTDTDVDGIEVTVFNMQTGSQPFATGTVFPLYDHPFDALVLKSISPDSKWVITTNPASVRHSSHTHPHREPHDRRQPSTRFR